MAQQPAGPSGPVIPRTHITSLISHDTRQDAHRGWWGFGPRDLAPAGWTLPATPPLDPHKYPHYTRRDLGSYLRIVHTAHQEFLHERRTLQETDQRQGLLGNVEEGEEGEEAANALQAAALNAHRPAGESGAGEICMCRTRLQFQLLQHTVEHHASSSLHSAL